MKVLLQDWTSYADALTWGVHEAYYKEQGVAAFEDGPIPHMATSHRLVARQHVRFLLDWWRLQLDDGRRPEQPVVIFEIGGGNGDFSLNFMRELASLTGDGRALYEVAQYVFTDFAKKTVSAVAARPEWAKFADRWSAQRLDLRSPPDGPVDVLIANYVACVCPVQCLQGEGSDWRQKEIRLSGSLKRGIDLPKKPSQNWFSATSRSGALKKVRTEERWSNFRPDGDALRLLKHLFPTKDDCSIIYPSGFLKAMDAWSDALTPSGYIMVSDLGEISVQELKGHHEWEPTRYGQTTNFGVPFPALHAWTQVNGGCAQLTRDRLASVHVAALFPNRASFKAIESPFNAHFIDCTEHEDLLDFVLAAEAFSDDKEPASAIRFYLRACALDPANLAIRLSLGEAYLDEEFYDEALEHLLFGADNDPFMRHDFAFCLGRLYALLDQNKQAIRWYERALEREEHPQVWKNLAALFVEAQNAPEALRYLDLILHLDPSDEESMGTRKKLTR